jgi:hypothetical protein
VCVRVCVCVCMCMGRVNVKGQWAGKGATRKAEE